MNGQQLIETARSGKPVIGTLVVSDSPLWPREIARLGVDFVFIDTEHVPIDRVGITWMCQTFAALNLAPVVRIGSPDIFEATRALDSGASGVIVPYVETAAQAKAMVAAVKCRPIRGQRSLRHVSGEEPFTGELAEYVRKGNAGNALFVNIESTPAIENLDSILAVEGLDGIFIGPHDLSCQLGVPEQYSHPTFEKTLRHIWRKARAAGKGAGIHAICGDLQQEIAWVTEGGCNVITHSADLLAVTRMLSSGIAELRKAVGGGSKSDSKSFTI